MAEGSLAANVVSLRPVKGKKKLDTKRWLPAPKVAVMVVVAPNYTETMFLRSGAGGTERLRKCGCAQP